MEVAAEQYSTRSSQPRRSWSYASGQVAALETRLLSRDFFEDLLSAQDASAARSALSRTDYRGAFLSDEAVTAYAESVTAFGEKLSSRILESCPPHIMSRFTELPKAYRLFRGSFLRMSSFGDKPEELIASFDFLVSNPGERKALSSHMALVWQRESPQSASQVAQSAFLDSCGATLMLTVASEAAESGVRTLLGDIAVLRTWSALLRSRWSGTEAEILAKWFILPAAYDGLAQKTAAAAGGDAVAAVAQFLSQDAAAALRAASPDRIREDVDAVAGEALRESVMAGRNVAFGPERVLAYLLALEVEQINLRIALASVISGIEAGRAKGRLRTEYV